ncbi:MAG TPA: CHAT domain-containing protein, partial [Isosphaeraceae bacterium]|nr:CHAT domain-containing protein [Isosphaeraceae bacterium]
LCVLAAPPEVLKVYNFDYELEHVVTQLDSEPSRLEVHRTKNPTRAWLRSEIADFRPDVVHVAGADTWQVAELLGWASRRERRDGVVLAGDDGPDEVDAEGISDLMAASDPPPRLLVCNTWNSAARVGALAVARGVGAAVGFQDVFDDSMAEMFFSDFYRALRLSGHEVLPAFRMANEAMQARPQRVTGSGVVLWRDHSIAETAAAAITPQAAAAPAPTAPKATAPGGRRRGPSAGAKAAKAEAEASAAAARVAETAKAVQTTEGVRQEFQKEKSATIKEGEARDLVEAVVVGMDHINYSLLHNNRGLFQRFDLKSLCKGVLRDVKIEVMLYVGGDTFPYVMTLDLAPGDVKSLLNDIRVPLTTEMGRGLRESVRTSLQVKGTWNGQTFYQNTLSVMMLAVDEWNDTEIDNPFLPSFVLPRDPVVARVIDAAQKYLMVLRDDSNAGFDGYQSIPEQGQGQPPPTPTPGDDDDPTEGVDLQVRSIWSSLMYESPTSYINPPPTYTRSSQRLRTPSDVIQGKRGTCIDLALLLSACLEYVDIYPVIFLLEGHCFPGYWRSEAAHDEFVSMTSPAQASASALGPTAAERGGGGGHGQSEPWYLDEGHYAEVMEWVYGGHLVPIETVWLTNRGSFRDAVDEGVKNLRSKDEFQAMIDVKRAREKVTPLPIQGGHTR